jgi:peptidoglycan-associated lipoprotein
MRRLLLFAAGLAFATGATAQLRVPTIVQRVIPGTRQQPPMPIGIDALRADFIARSGASTIYFVGDSNGLTQQARATLAAQALWLRQHPEVTVRIEGHAALGDTRDHALAVGARRAEEVRQYLVLMGVPAAQLAAVSMGKEEPGPPRAVTVLKDVIMPPAAYIPPR